MKISGWVFKVLAVVLSVSLALSGTAVAQVGPRETTQSLNRSVAAVPVTRAPLQRLGNPEVDAAVSQSNTLGLETSPIAADDSGSDQMESQTDQDQPASAGVNYKVPTNVPPPVNLTIEQVIEWIHNTEAFYTALKRAYEKKAAEHYQESVTYRHNIEVGDAPAAGLMTQYSQSEFYHSDQGTLTNINTRLLQVLSHNFLSNGAQGMHLKDRNGDSVKDLANVQLRASQLGIAITNWTKKETIEDQYVNRGDFNNMLANWCGAMILLLRKMKYEWTERQRIPLEKYPPKAETFESVKQMAVDLASDLPTEYFLRTYQSEAEAPEIPVPLVSVTNVEVDISAGAFASMVLKFTTDGVFSGIQEAVYNNTANVDGDMLYKGLLTLADGTSQLDILDALVWMTQTRVLGMDVDVETGKQTLYVEYQGDPYMVYYADNHAPDSAVMFVRTLFSAAHDLGNTGSKNLSVGVAINGTAIVTYNGRTVSGTYDAETHSMALSAPRLENEPEHIVSQTWALGFEEGAGGMNRLNSFEIQQLSSEDENSTSRSVSYILNSDGSVNSVTTASESDTHSSQTTIRYAYVNLDLNGIRVKKVASTDTNSSDNDGGYETTNGTKTYYQYNQNGKQIGQLDVSVSTENGQTYHAASYRENNLQNYHPVTTTVSVKGVDLRSRIHSWEDRTIIDRYALTKTTTYHANGIDSELEFGEVELSMTEVRTSLLGSVPATFEIRSYQERDGNVLFIVKGNADVPCDKGIVPCAPADGDPADQKILRTQKVNGYSVYYGQYGSSYGLVFSKLGEQPVIVDYPNTTIVTLNEEPYNILIHSNGIVELTLIVAGAPEMQASLQQAGNPAMDIAISQSNTLSLETRPVSAGDSVNVRMNAKKNQKSVAKVGVHYKHPKNILTPGPTSIIKNKRDSLQS